jgi:hypothetical protein
MLESILYPPWVLFKGQKSGKQSSALARNLILAAVEDYGKEEPALGGLLLWHHGSYATFTSIAFGLAFSDFGRRICSSPSLNSAETLASSTTSGRAKLRTNDP